MIETISYYVVGGCLLWTVWLVIHLCIESSQDVAELEKICHQHTKKDW